MNTLRFARAPHVLALLLTVLGLLPAMPVAAQAVPPFDVYPVDGPCRVYDSRRPGDVPSGPLNPVTVHTVVLAGACGIPAEADGAVLTVGVFGAMNPGSLAVFQAGITPPGAVPLEDSVSFDGANAQGVPQNRAKMFFVPFGPGGAVSFRALIPGPGNVTYHVFMDVAGYTTNAEAWPDTATVLEDAAAAPIPVLGNDIDPDDPLAIASATDPLHGMVTLTGGTPGTGLNYQPDPNYCNDSPGGTRDTSEYRLNAGSFAEVAVTVTCVNDAPAGTNTTVTTPEDTDYVFTAADFGFTDPDDTPANALLAVVITTLPGAGSLELSNVAVTAGQSIPVGDITLGNLTFTPVTGENGVPYTTFTFQVQDGGGTANSGIDLDATPNTMTVNVSDVNDPPAPSGGPFTLAENSTVGTVVGTVAANDPDPGQTHTFAITAGNTGGAFAIDNAGVITVANQAALNFETTPTFNLAVEATDNGMPVLSGSTTVVVNLTDGNEPPVPTGGPFSLPENSAASTVVGTVMPNDPDVGQSHTYAITAGNTGGAFSIDGAGVITVATPAALDFETTPTFNLTVEATDNGTPVLSGSATVVINLTNANDAPVPSGGPFSVAENSANGTTVGTVTFTDQDNPGQSHTFAITAGNTGGAFAIDGSGVITVANGTVLNFETTPTFNLTVEVTDNGTPVLSGSTTVVVNLTDVNEAPVPSGGPFSVAENSANGTTVGTVLAGDPDGGQTHTFSITAGNTGGAFAINGSGVITVANSTVLSFETTPTFNLTVQVTDNGTPVLSGSTTVVVNLTDVNEAPVPSGGPFSLAENSANGTTVGTVLAGDPDSGQTHTFSITAGNTGGAFAINGSGVITVANSAALNFETTPTFNLTVQVTDNGTPVLSGSTTVVVNLTDVNEAPVPSGGPCSVAENSASGTTVCTVLAGDPDGGQSHTFAITAGNTGGAFAINGSGVITVASTAALDFETTPVFNLTVQVTDNGTPVLSGSATVVVNLTNVNEAPVPSGGPFTIPENSPNGTSVGTVTVADPDVGQSHTFSITAGNTGGAFAINSSGLITVANVTAVNFEATPTFTLTVQVSDNGTPVLSGSTTVTINLLNVPETPIAGDEGTLASPYVEAVGNTILEVDALSDLVGSKVYFNGNILTNDTDPDGPTTFTLTLESATAGALVTLSPDGTFTYVPPPGFTGVDNFVYRITDPTSLFDTGTVYINVEHRVWYVRNNTGTAGTAGTTADPFDTLAEAESASGVGDTIYLFEGDGTTADQGDGITLKSGQRLLGEAVQLAVPTTVNINGTNGLTLRSTTGNRPKIENDNTPDAPGEDNGVNVPATAGSMTGVEIRGLDITGLNNAIDVTTSGANNAEVRISDNTISNDATNGLEGVDVNAGGTGTVTVTASNNALSARGNAFDARTSAAGALRVDFSNNTNVLSSTGSGVVIDGSFAGSSATITGFANNTVHRNTAGAGISVTSATFDGTAGGTFQTVTGGSTTVGASGDGVGTSAMVLTNVQGDLSFTDLDLYASNGAALRASSTTGYTGSAGLRLTVGSNVATFNALGGPAVDVTTATIDLQLANLTSTTPTSGVSLTNVAGTFTVPTSPSHSITKSSGGGAAFSVDNSAAGTTVLTSTYGGTINNSSSTGRSVSINNADSGSSATFAGQVTDNPGQGVTLTANTGATISFSGGLTLSTSTSTGFNATGGGTVAVTDPIGAANNTIATTTGTALNVNATTIGASGFTFERISAGTSGSPANGIVLNNTGSGALTVTGTGSAGSGGTINSATGAGVSLTSTGTINLSYMNVQNGGDDGIRGLTVNGFNLTSVNVTSNGNAVGERGIELTELTSTGSMSNCTVTGSAEDNVYIVNDGAGNLTSFNVTGSTFATTAQAAPGNDGFLIQNTGSGDMAVSITGSTFTDNRGDHFQASFDATATSTASMDVTFSNNTLNTTAANDPNVLGGGITLSPSGGGDMTFMVSTNNIQQAFAAAINLNLGTGATATASMNGTVTNNTIGTAGSTDSGSESSDGIDVIGNAAGSTTVTITNNQVRQFSNDSGIKLLLRDGTGSMNATVTGNTVKNPGTFAVNGIHTSAGATAGDTGTMCVQISGNDVSGSSANGGTEIRARQRFGTTVRLPGYGGANNDTAAVNTFISGQNSGATTSSVVNVPGGGGFIGGAACSTP